MKFHGLMLIRDEEDILRQCLEHLLTWIDGLYIMDLGSTDSTWQIVEEFARKDRRVVPFYTKPIVYHDALRCVLFQHYRDRFLDGDWICKVDADEIYQTPPPKFVKEHVRSGETAVWLQWYFFRLTSLEVADYESGRVDILQDRKRPIEQRRRFYKIPEYAEPRMFRYRSTMQWPETAAFPINAGFVARERIPIRHYPHRDPLQMERRYRLRSAMMQMKGSSAGPHWCLDDWHKDVIEVDSEGRASERNVGLVGLGAAQGHTAGELKEWITGEALPVIRSTEHLPSLPKRVLQRVIHPLFLPILDRFRKSLSKDYAPHEIPEDVTQWLRNSS